jgi:hypothetical protein
LPNTHRARVLALRSGFDRRCLHEHDELAFECALAVPPPDVAKYAAGLIIVNSLRDGRRKLATSAFRGGSG